jgi:predicted dehydrogenase
VTARVALIGANGHGRTHRRVIAELDQVDLVAIGDVAAVGDAPEGVPVFADHRDLLAATAPDIVIVCTPPHTHARIAEDALRGGADVLLEKPPVLDAAEHRHLMDVVEQTGRACQVGFQALASPALAELLSTVDAGRLGQVATIAAVGAWKRHEAYFGRSDWAGRRSVRGRPSLDGALANPFAHAVMQVLAIARRSPVRVEVERYRTRDIEVDDTAALRLSFDGGPRALVVVTLCAEDFAPGEITVTGTSGTAVLEYPTDRLRLPGERDLREVPGRAGLLANLVEHRSTGRALIAPLARTLPFTEVLDRITAAPVAAIGPAYLREADDLPTRRRVVVGINETLEKAAASLSLFSELSVPWAIAAREGSTP